MGTHFLRSRSIRRLGALIPALALGLLTLLAPLGKDASPRAQAPMTAGPPAGMQKIQHIIWIIQENHSYDNYFGTFPNADGIPPSACLAEMPGSAKCVKP